LRQLALPAAVKSVAGYASLYIAAGFVYVLRLNRLNGEVLSTYKGVDWFLLALRVTCLVAVVLLSALFVILPATVTLVRVEASLLPEEIETLVPFDRTFGGRVQAGMVGINVLRIKAARQSFGWPQIKRLLGVYVKMFFILTAICAVAFHVVGLEVYIVMGDALKKLVVAGVAEARAGNYRL